MWSLWKKFNNKYTLKKASIHIRKLNIMIRLYNEINIKSTYLYTLKIKEKYVEK